MRKPNIELLERLAKYFNVEISYFFEKNEKKFKKSESHHAECVSLSKDIKEKTISIEDLRELADTIDIILNRSRD